LTRSIAEKKDNSSAVQELEKMKHDVEALRAKAVKLSAEKTRIDADIERCTNDIRLLEQNLSGGKALNVCLYCFYVFISRWCFRMRGNW
jgi:hypothetical protein